MTTRSNNPSSFKVEVKTSGDTSWAANGLRFPTEAGATAYGADLAARWTGVTDWRVTASGDNATTDSTTVRWSEAGAARPDVDAPAWRVSL